MMQQTSLMAYFYLKNNYYLTGNREKVYQAIKLIGPCSNETVAKFLKMPINCITPRVLELRKMQLVANYGIKDNERGRKVNLWETRK